MTPLPRTRCAVVLEAARACVAVGMSCFAAAVLGQDVPSPGDAPAMPASVPLAAAAAPAQRRNAFDDPFLQATRGVQACPRPDPPLLTEAEIQHEAHWRAERGTSCFRSGRCRLPNAYLYDQEIAPRVVKAIEAAGAFADTTVWVEVQRRWVWLKGCVARADQAADLERVVHLIDDVEAVIPQLIVGPRMPPGAPVYRLAGEAGDAGATIDAPVRSPAPSAAAPAR